MRRSPESAGIISRDSNRSPRDIGGTALHAGFQLQRYRQRARTGSHIKHALSALDHPQRDFHDMLGFRPRNEHVRRNAEFAAVKLLAAGDVLCGLALEPLMKVAAVVEP